MLDKDIRRLIKSRFLLSIISVLLMLLVVTGVFLRDRLDLFQNAANLIDSEVNGAYVCYISDCDALEPESVESLLEIGGYILYSDFRVGFISPFKGGSYIKTGAQEYHFIMISFLGISLIFLSFIFYTSTLSIIKKVTLDGIADFASKEAILSNQIRGFLTEDLHHELKTPLSVISSKILLIKESGREHGLEYSSNDLKEAFDLIDFYLQAVYVSLDRMQGFKAMKYSEGNKSIYDVALAATSTIGLRNKGGFCIDVDSRLCDYHLLEEGLRDGDLLNIFLNHLKNSLEASAVHIKISIRGFFEGKCIIHIVDDGNGIPPSALGKVYTPLFSTKGESQGAPRGIGMYLSREVLRSHGGEEFIKDTSGYGTVLELSVPAERAKDS